METIIAILIALGLVSAEQRDSLSSERARALAQEYRLNGAGDIEWEQGIGTDGAGDIEWEQGIAGDGAGDIEWEK